ncbi:MAG TPA: energy transducer TonB [Vicinamibacterales bacterium]|nr:energy transducer TonB [Vicinamibacterales bacterium]
MTARLALVLAASFGVVMLAQQAGTPPPAQQEQVYRPGPGIQNPVVIRTAQPKYTSEALRAQIQGVVELEGTVAPDGTLQDIRITKSLDSSLGLDQEAIAAARQWLFRPGIRQGRVIPVIVTLILEFRIHSQPTPKALSPANIIAGDDFYTDTYPLMQTGLVQPTIRTSVQPKYTADAMRAKIQGMVEVEAVIQADGTVGRARVLKSLDQQLDNTALDAVRQWVFEPGKLNAQAVPVVVKLTLEFRLH